MSLIDVDGDPWLREQEACEKLFREIAAQLSERDSEIPSSSAYGKLSALLRVRLRQFTVEVQQLREKHVAIARNDIITPHEAERRTRLVEQLESGILHLQKRFNASSRSYVEDENRTQLMPDKARARVFADMESTGWGEDDGNSSETFNVERAQKLVQQVVKEQDGNLETLAQIIARQKTIARTIGNEVEEQNEILDDLSQRIERTTEGLINETRQVSTITRKDRTCGYWVVIMLLFIAILVVAFL